jgi:hypothetical protein
MEAKKATKIIVNINPPSSSIHLTCNRFILAEKTATRNIPINGNNGFPFVGSFNNDGAHDTHCALHRSFFVHIFVVLLQTNSKIAEKYPISP